MIHNWLERRIPHNVAKDWVLSNEKLEKAGIHSSQKSRVEVVSSCLLAADDKILSRVAIREGMLPRAKQV